MNFPARFLDEIRNRLTLSDIIGQRVTVKRAGREFKACCPFHNEKTPSFTINDQKQFFHCFGCGAHGDVIGFVMRHDNLSFPETVELLAGKAGLPIPKSDPEARKKAEKAKSLYDLMNEAALFFENAFRGPPMDYMLDRDLSKETLGRFRIGYAPKDGQALRSHLKLKGFTDKQMVEAGVLKESSRGGEPYAFFRERIMFPVSDRRGRIMAFGGRILPDHMRVPNRGDYVPPKYINSSDTPLFDKGRTLYGESLSRQVVKDGQSVIVVEGYMDVIAAHQAGFSGAVAPMGTALTDDQMLSLWSMYTDDYKVPILCFDGDAAGRRAASRACERIMPLLGPGRSVKFAFMPEGEDPDTLIRNSGRGAFEAVLDSALPLFDFIWLRQTMGRALDTPEARAAVSSGLHRQISAIAHKDVQNHYRRQIQDKVSAVFFPKRAFRGQAKNEQKGGEGVRPVSPMSKGLRRPLQNGERLKALILLASVLNHPHIYESIEEIVGRFDIPDGLLNRLRQEVTTILEEKPDLDREALRNHLTENGFSQEVGDILNQSVYVHASFCGPSADSQVVLPRFMEWLKELEVRDWREINGGWLQALNNNDQSRERQLKEMIKIKSLERASD